MNIIKKRNKFFYFFLFLVFLCISIGYWIHCGSKSKVNGSIISYQLKKRKDIYQVLIDLEKKGIITNSKAVWPYFVFLKRLKTVSAGIYKIKSGMSLQQINDVFKRPLKRLLQFPEGWWIKRTSKFLEQQYICQSQEYITLSNQPQLFQEDVKFELPQSGTLEGYLFPDTYDFPVGTNTKDIILKQLKTFYKKIYLQIPFNKRTELNQILIKASIIELEASDKQDREMVAGVIENRLKKNMRLELCTSALYGAQQWKQLKPGDTARIKSKYNTYHFKGLPPHPLCSPTWESVRAVLNPEIHNYLYFVWIPGKGHKYSRTFKEHLAGIRERKKQLAAR